VAIQAVRYIVAESDEAFDAVLKHNLINMLLVMLQDKSLKNRRLAMKTLNSTAHNKPELILPHLGELMPFVLSESVIKPELVKVIDLGPFKEYVDGGLDLRKVYIYTLFHYWHAFG
jgi:cullin-associated NEDD8-dissociated protein 1